VADPWRFSVSVAAAVVRDDGRMLAIQRRDNSHWEPPGGLVEPGETVHQTLVREVGEETGILVEAERLSGVYQNMSRDIVALVFRCHAIGGELRTSHESVAVDWLAPNEISERMDEAYAARLLDAALDGAAVRTHDGKQLLP
jgi:8-oxo-dGTP diphosphatase